MDPLVKRINELYKKQKAGSLTAEEKEEQDTLRRQYIDQVKGNLANTLDSTVIVREDGSRERLQKRASDRKLH